MLSQYLVHGFGKLETKTENPEDKALRSLKARFWLCHYRNSSSKNW